MSFKKVVIIVLMLCTCIPIIICAVYFNLVYSKTLMDDLEKSIITNIEFSRQNIEKNMRYLEDTYMRVVADEGISQSLNTFKYSTDQYEKNQIKSDMTTELQNILNFSSSWREKVIDTFFVFMDEDNYVGVIRHGKQQALIEEHKEIYKNQKLLKKEGQYFLSKTNDDIVYLTRDFYELEQFQPIGQLVMGINVNQLVKSDASNDYLDENVQLVFDSHGEILSSSLEDSSTQVSDQIYMNRNSSQIFETIINDKAYFVGISRFEYYDYYTAILIPKESVQQKQIKLSRNFTIIILSMGAITLIIGLIVANFITRPLKLITDECKDSVDKNFMTKLPEFKVLEFNNISSAFNTMLAKIDYLINQVYRKQLLLQESEMKMLQSQVNPHFIFNILDTIAWEALAQKQKEIYGMINSLADIIRNNMVYANLETITVQQELNYVKDYVYLQKVRFEERLEVDVTVMDEAIYQFYIPKLSIQPFVDNGIVHGIEKKDGPGRLEVNLRLEGNTLICLIEDNGIGYEHSMEAEHKHTGTGISNVNKRIKLRYGEAYGATVHSKKGEGTKVVLTLPVDRKGDQHV
ncbi:sensor histidine kinase [Vallitalea okinawensis]|uniref:sensor histidine kinase n=1 Tax=Vallitalea okinawensis TaxID=2078660 RepID=UPI000CFD481C|nr:histidine kinase [Vallitalea okinawensis]